MSNYVIYRLPDKDQCVYMSSQSQPVALNSVVDLNGREGFVITPFAPSDENPVLLLVPDHTEIVKIRMEKDSVSGNRDAVSSSKACDVSGERDAYQKVFKVFHDQLEADEFEKIVLARRSRRYMEMAPVPEDLFQKACLRYPHLFVALVSTEQSGTWLMATPEILLNGDGKVWQTMALAGTMKSVSEVLPDQINPESVENVDAMLEHKNGSLRNILWTKKNVHEQYLVADYIEKCIRRFSNHLERTLPYTIRAADLLHLKSDFRFTLQGQDHLGELLDALYPTPAVCGLPKEKARRFILNNECFPRRYYSGFQGPLSFQGETHLYVALRCMQITDRYCDLYAGGGLLKDSHCEDEWLETEAKLGTMERLL
jgi:isochorismate synthase